MVNVIKLTSINHVKITKSKNNCIWERTSSYCYCCIYYIKMKVCVCVCVCVYVCQVAWRRTYTTNHPEIWHGLLIWPRLGTEPGGDPKCWPPGVPPIVPPSEKPWRVNNWAGASKQKLLLGVGLPCKILFVGNSHKPGARRVHHPTKWGCMLWELGRDQQTKVAPRGGFVYKNLFVGVSPQPKACRVLRSICTGLYHDEIVK
jgi:hypothetical protein